MKHQIRGQNRQHGRTLISTKNAKRPSRRSVVYDAGYEKKRTQRSDAEGRNAKTRLIRKALSRAHRRGVQQVIEDGPRGMWRLAKWARNRTREYETLFKDPRSSDTRKACRDGRSESRSLSDGLFPQPPPADLSDTVSVQYPQPIEFPPITALEIQAAVKTAKAGKAPGEDGIPNSL